MKLLVLQGPNLNLIGVKSSQTGKRITLDKINKNLRREVRNREIELKIFQTHKIYMAISFLQRNRNAASGVLIAPMAWAKYEFSLLETLELIQLPVVQVILENTVEESQSILSSIAIDPVYNDDSIFAFKNGLKSLIKHLS